MESLELSTYVLPGGRIPPEDRDIIKGVLRKGVGKRIAISISEVEDTRTARQNRYFHAVVLKRWHEHIVNHGNLHVTRQNVKDWLKQSVGAAFFFDTITLDGRPTAYVKSSARLPKGKFSEFIDACIAMAAERGFEIPPPKPEEI
jgi:hypothetical protein